MRRPHPLEPITSMYPCNAPPNQRAPNTFGLRLFSISSVLPTLVHSTSRPLQYRNTTGSLLEKWSKFFRLEHETDSSTLELRLLLGGGND